MIDRQAIEERRRLATEKTKRALRALESLGVKAWVVGSLTSDRFGLHSDVDILVDCDQSTEYQAFMAIEEAMGDFPFHLIPLRRLRDESVPYIIDGAVDAASFISG